MKRSLLLGFLLASVWLLWSGHFAEPFLLVLGISSVVAVTTLAARMQIADDEGAPIGLGLRPISYALWLGKEIIVANIEVTKTILDKNLPIQPKMVRVKASQRTELGRVILANSITLTPGTVSVDMQGDRIWVHALSHEGAEDDLSGDMDERVCDLEVHR